MIDKKDIPNHLTYARVAAVPLSLGLIWLNASWTSYVLFFLFLAASATDFLDGYLARKWNAVSERGALLDPAADKLLVALMLLYIVTHDVMFTDLRTVNMTAGPITAPLDINVEERFYGYSLVVPAALIILRELFISGLREFLSARNVPLPVSQIGKWKTALQMIAIGVLLFCFNWPSVETWRLGEVLLWVSAILAVISAAQYTRAAWTHLK